MAEKTATPGDGLAAVLSTPTATSTRTLLTCGVVSGPLFIVIAVAQMLMRDGFDPRKHPISLLSVGGMGWIQITNFVIAGALFVAAAIGMRRMLHPGTGGTWGPLLIGALGVSLIWGGVFVVDPTVGFPPGRPEGIPNQQTWHSALHTIALSPEASR